MLCVFCFVLFCFFLFPTSTSFPSHTPPFSLSHTHTNTRTQTRATPRIILSSRVFIYSPNINYISHPHFYTRPHSQVTCSPLISSTPVVFYRSFLHDFMKLIYCQDGHSLPCSPSQFHRTPLWQHGFPPLSSLQQYPYHGSFHYVP